MEMEDIAGSAEEELPVAKPSLIVVAGAPGTGKTTLARALAAAVRCPVIGRDEIKEGLLHTPSGRSAAPDEMTRRATLIFFDAVTFFTERNVSIVAEAAFQHRVWAPKLEALQHRAEIKLVICHVDRAVARARIVERGRKDPARAAYHDDAWALAQPDYDPPRLPIPTLTVDTTNGYRPEFERIVAFAKERSSGRA